jgi:hypothetical protein
VETERAVFRWCWLLLDRWVRVLNQLIAYANLTRGTFRLKDHAENAIPDEIYEKRFERWPEEAPNTKEGYYLRDVFDSELPRALHVASADYTL